jgi:protein-tyrosine phosphatase
MLKKFRDSITDPIEVDWATENLGMSFAPGKHARSMFGKPWKRDLKMDLERLKETHKCDILISLVEETELQNLKIPKLAQEAKSLGIEVVRFPIPDTNVPSLEDARKVASYAKQRMDEGKRVVYHCRGGLGRAGTMCACTLVFLGHDAITSVIHTRHTRPRAIENSLQENFIYKFKKYTEVL